MSANTPSSSGESSTAPTGDRWAARPVAAGLLRAAIVASPLIASTVVLLVMSHVWRAPAGDRHFWLAALAVVAVLVAFAVERGARRLLPLASLLRLTMLFPDQAPSRLRIARAAGTTGQYLDRLARSDDDTAQVAAEKVLTLITALGNHDRKTRGHSERVRLYCDLLAEQLRVPKGERDRLRWGALLHDIGKLEIAPTILNKPAKLSDREFARIREHPSVGAEIAAPLLPWLEEWGGGIVDHHERWDGGGYPAGRAGTEISRAGRIVGVVDAFETMTAARVYKKAMTTRAARAELAACAGSQFDPDYVRAFLAISLPRVLWAMGPLAFLVQLPFLRSIARFGSQATQLSMQGASSAGVAAAASVIGVAAAPAVAASHGHSHSHSHSHSAVLAASVTRGDGSAQSAGGTAAGTGISSSGLTGASGAAQSVEASRVISGPANLPSVPVRPGQQPGSAGQHQGAATGPGSRPSAPAPGASTSAPLAVAPTTAYTTVGQLVTIDVLSDNASDLVASTVSIATGPTDGSATVSGGGSISYQPQSGFHGVDQLGFEVCNAAGQCGTAPVTVNVLGPAQSGADYSGVDFSGMDLHGFNFAGATLRATNFSGANLAGVNFSGADLTGAVLHAARLGQANLTNAVLAGADLSSASLSDVIANGVDVSGANLAGVTGGSAPGVSALNLSTTLGKPVTINVASMVSDPFVPIDWSTLAITKDPAHGTVRITGPHTIVYTPAAGLLSVVQFGFSVANVLSFTAHGTQSVAVVL